jgi:hypothetical protein
MAEDSGMEEQVDLFSSHHPDCKRICGAIHSLPVTRLWYLIKRRINFTFFTAVNSGYYVILHFRTQTLPCPNRRVKSYVAIFQPITSTMTENHTGKHPFKSPLLLSYRNYYPGSPSAVRSINHPWKHFSFRWPNCGSQSFTTVINRLDSV